MAMMMMMMTTTMMTTMTTMTMTGDRHRCATAPLAARVRIGVGDALQRRVARRLDERRPRIPHSKGIALADAPTWAAEPEQRRAWATSPRPPTCDSSGSASTGASGAAPVFMLFCKK